jgi:hypothetical protein
MIAFSLPATPASSSDIGEFSGSGRITSASRPRIAASLRVAAQSVDKVSVRIGVHGEAWSPDWLQYRFVLGRRIMIVASAAVWMITVIVAALPNWPSSVLTTPGIAVLDAVVTVALLQAIHSSYETEFYRAVGG